MFKVSSLKFKVHSLENGQFKAIFYPQGCKSGSRKTFEIIQFFPENLNLCQTYPKVEFSNIVFRGVEVKKSKIRLKSEILHPCIPKFVKIDFEIVTLA